MSDLVRNEDTNVIGQFWDPQIHLILTESLVNLVAVSKRRARLWFGGPPGSTLLPTLPVSFVIWVSPATAAPRTLIGTWDASTAQKQQQQRRQQQGRQH